MMMLLIQYPLRVCLPRNTIMDGGWVLNWKGVWFEVNLYLYRLDNFVLKCMVSTSIWQFDSFVICNLLYVVVLLHYDCVTQYRDNYDGTNHRYGRSIILARKGWCPTNLGVISCNYQHGNFRFMDVVVYILIFYNIFTDKCILQVFWYNCFGTHT